VSNIITPSTSDYAALNMTTAANCLQWVGVKDSLTDYPAGTFAGFGY
jgi:hypothetical protein